MKQKNRILVIIASLLLTGVYLFPIWDIELQAPQYPEGMGMKIWVNNVAGYDSNDLQNINKLNEYVGMKPIEPDAIPELVYMPYIFGFLIVTGLAVAVWGTRPWLLVWLVLFVLLAIVGMVDFYLWEYDYGHDLDPDAVIKVPGQTYQPPLIGSKKMMNITATSLPDIGFYLSVASMGLAGLAWWKEDEEHE